MSIKRIHVVCTDPQNFLWMAYDADDPSERVCAFVSAAAAVGYLLMKSSNSPIEIINLSEDNA